MVSYLQDRETGQRRINILISDKHKFIEDNLAGKNQWYWLPPEGRQEVDIYNLVVFHNHGEIFARARISDIIELKGAWNHLEIHWSSFELSKKERALWQK